MVNDEGPKRSTRDGILEPANKTCSQATSENVPATLEMWQHPSSETEYLPSGIASCRSLGCRIEADFHMEANPPSNPRGSELVRVCSMGVLIRIPQKIQLFLRLTRPISLEASHI